MSYGVYRQYSNGNYEPIEDNRVVICQHCGEEIHAYSPVFDKGQRFLCSSCYLETLFKADVIGEWYMDDEDMAKKIADLFDDIYMDAEEMISEYAPSDLDAFF